MKTKKGLISAYIKIILIILILGAVVYGALKIFIDAQEKIKFETIKTNMLLIQGKTEVIAQKVNIKEKDAKYIGIKIKEKQDDEKIKNLVNNNIIDIDSKDSNLYCIDNLALRELGLDSIQIQDYYIVDYKKNDVIYVDGVENEDDNVVYKLSEMK